MHYNNTKNNTKLTNNNKVIIGQSFLDIGLKGKKFVEKNKLKDKTNDSER